MAAVRAASTLLAVAAALSLAGCAGAARPGDQAPPSPPSATGAFDGTWTSDDGAAWLTLVDDELTGSDGCNAVTGSYSADGASIAFSLGLMTRKACVGVTLSFGPLTSGRVDGERLALYDAEGAELITLSRA